MQGTYLNWAATSYRKPETTIKAVCDYLQQNENDSIGRELTGLAENRIALQTRLAVAELFHAETPSNIVFTPNVTTALNMILNGLLKPGDHVLATSVEHNAVARPLYLLEQQGVLVDWLECDETGQLQPEKLTAAILPNTRVLVMNHASNVLGTILPVKECFELARDKGIITVLDSAQTAGFLPIHMDELAVDILAFTGHKSLMGLPGSGGFVVREEIHPQIQPWMTGGTGSISESLEQPAILPDKFEPGTQNTVSILSLGHSIRAILAIGLPEIQAHEQQLLTYFIEGLEALPVRVLGTGNAMLSAPVVSITCEKLEAGVLGQQLYEKAQIITRSGLHCAPLAHQTAGTYPEGTLRFSFGYYTTKAEVEYCLQALQQIL